MQISASFITEAAAPQPQFFHGQSKPRLLLPEAPSCMVNNSISSLLLSLPLANSLLSDICTPALLLVSLKASVTHNTPCPSFFLSPGEVSLTSRCFTHIFFPIFSTLTVFSKLFSTYWPHLFHRGLVFPPPPLCVSSPCLWAKQFPPSLTPPSLPFPRVTGKGDIFWMMCWESELVDGVTRKSRHRSSSLAPNLSSIVCNCSSVTFCLHHNSHGAPDKNLQPQLGSPHHCWGALHQGLYHQRPSIHLPWQDPALPKDLKRVFLSFRLQKCRGFLNNSYS